MTQTINKDFYYTLCANLDKTRTFGELHRQWHAIFTYTLRHWKVGYTQRLIDHLFYKFDMSNWKAMYQENTEYKNHTPEQLHETFCDEVSRICHRMTYDHLFRAHWLFLNAHSVRMIHHKYPNLYPASLDDDVVQCST